MESHYLTVLFPPQRITLPAAPPSPTYCLSAGKQNGVWGDATQGPMRTGRRGASVCICSLAHTLYKQMSLCLLCSADLWPYQPEPTATTAALSLLALKSPASQGRVFSINHFAWKYTKKCCYTNFGVHQTKMGLKVWYSLIKMWNPKGTTGQSDPQTGRMCNTKITWLESFQRSERAMSVWKN